MEINQLLSFEVQMGHFQKKAGVLIVLIMVTKEILGMAFIEKHVKRISAKAGLVISINLSSVAIIDETRHSYIPTNIVKSDAKQDLIFPDEDPCVILRTTSLSRMSQTIVKLKTSSGAIRLVATHLHLIRKRRATAVKGTADNGPGVSFKT